MNLYQNSQDGNDFDKEREKILGENVVEIAEIDEKLEKKILEKRRIYKRKRKKPFNVARKNTPKLQKFFDIWHFLMDWSWYKVFLGFFFLFVLSHLFFGLLYFLGGPKAVSNVNLSNFVYHYLDCVFFSVQTFSTIGYGRSAPLTVYSNGLVTIQIFFGYFFDTFWLALVLCKFSRPTRLRRNVIFSKKAVIYKNKSGNYVIKLRISNTRHKTKTLNRTIRLILFEWDQMNSEKYKLSDLSYTIHGLEDPVLFIPFGVKHVIDEKSPFFKYLENIENETDPWKKKKNWELVVYFDGTDSSTSNDYQAFTSYCYCDVVLNRKFKKCFSFNKKKGKYIVDYLTFEKTIECT